MLQFVTTESARFSIAEEARMVIEGGCRWIQLSSKGMGGDETAMKDIAGELVPLCQENEAFLILEDNVGLVEELKVHGVFLNDNSRSTVMAAREQLGAHAVIGVRAREFNEILALKGLDIDYVSVPEPCGVEGASFASLADKYKYLLNRMNEAGIDFHLVACGDFAPDELPQLIEAGCAGVAMSAAIADAHDPVAATSRILSILEKARDYGAAATSDADSDSVNV